ncbi:MAG: TIGR02996 domain-containing protein, partial [Gemmataceae bacterium]
MESAFLRAIADDPDDLVSRRVYADWLEEQPDAARHERAEFLRLQFARAAGALAARQRELLERHRGAWEGRFRGLIRSCEYRNGFAERVTLDGEHFVG